MSDPKIEAVNQKPASELSKFEKRVIHANWASDTRPIEDTPELRQLDSGTFVRVDTVLNALRLWIIQRAIVPVNATAFCSTKKCTHRCRRPDFAIPDDDPPPCAASASIPARPIYTKAKAVPLSEAEETASHRHRK